MTAKRGSRYEAFFSVVAALVLLVTVGCSNSPAPGPGGPNNPHTFAPKISVSGQDTVQAGLCVAYNLQIIDGSGNAWNGDGNYTAFSVSPAGKVFSDNTCTVSVSNVVVSPTGSGVVYLKDTVRENVSLAVSASGGNINLAGVKSVSVLGGDPTNLLLASTASNATNTCVAVSVKTVDAYNNLTTSHPAIAVSLNASGIANASVYSDSSCLTQTSSVTIPAGMDSKVFYAQASSVGTLNIIASAALMTPDDIDLAFVAGSAARLVMSGPSGNVTASSCVQVTVESRRADGTALVVAGASLPVTISVVTGSNINLFSDLNCVAALGAFNIPAGQSSEVFFVKTAQAPQASSLSANAASYVSGSIGIQWIPIPATQLAIQGTPANLEAGSCGVGQVALLDANNNPAFVSSPRTIQMSAGGSSVTDFYASANCSGAVISTLNLAMCSNVGPCNNVVSFSFKPKLVGTASLNAVSSGVSSGSASVNVTTPSGSPTVLVLSRVTTVPALAGSCLEYRIKSQDQYGNPVNVSPTDLVLNLTSSSSSNLGQFFSDSNCVTSTTSVQIDQGTSLKQFYFQNPRAEQVLLSATNGVLSAQQTTNLGVNTPAKLVWNNVPASMVATKCSSAISVKQTDAFDNNTNVAVTFNLIGANGVQFYADSLCSQMITSGVIAQNTSASVPFYFSGPNMGAAQLSAVAVTPASITQAAIANVNFTTPPALHIALSCDANNILNPACAAVAAGACRPVYAASLDSANALYLPVGGSLAVGMSSTSSVSGLFYSNSLCTVPLVNNTVSLDSANNPKVFYVKNTMAENFSVTATPAVGTAGSIALSTSASTPSKLVIASSGPSTFLNKYCAGPFQVNAQDAFGNTAAFPLATTVQFNNSTLNGNGVVVASTFFSDSACTTSNVQFAANGSSAQFYIKSQNAGTLNVLALASGITQAGTRSFVITDGARIAFMSGTQEVGSINFQSVVVNTLSQSQTLEVKNMSSADAASISSLAFTGPFQRSAAGGTCPTVAFTLAAQQSCTFVLEFAPVATGAATGSLVANFSSTSVVNPMTTTVALSGTGTSAPFSTPVLNPVGGVTFQNIPTGTTYTYNAQLTNPNYYAVTFTGVVGPSAPYSISAASPCSNTFPFTLAANASCTVTISMSPTAAGSFNSSVQYQFTHPSTSQVATTNSMPLTGSAIGQTQNVPYLSLSTINFGTVSVGSSATQTMNFVNPNNSAVTVTGTLNIAAPFSISLAAPCSNVFPFSMAANTSCLATVTYSPSSAVSSTGSVKYTTSAGHSNVTSLSGQGTSSPAAVLSLSPSNYNFGTVALNTTSSTVSFTLSNLANQSVDSIGFENYQLPFAINLGTCGGTLAVGQSCTFTATFRPTASASYSAAVRLKWRNVSSNTQSSVNNALTLSGTGGTSGGGNANLYFDVSSIYFGYVPIGQAYSYYVMVTNYGQSTATNLQLVGSGSNNFWMSKGTCGSTLAAGASCYINVGFQPWTYGYSTAQVGMSFISNNVIYDTQKIQLSGYGY